MFYKAMYNGRVVDVLDHLAYVKYQPKHKIMVLCPEDEAQGFLSSAELYKFPAEAGNVDTVELIPIDTYEYRQLKALGGKTPEEIIDAYTLELINGGVL